jgi:oligopeptide/dipeptide ABC transporter ATP-binding protein
MERVDAGLTGGGMREELLAVRGLRIFARSGSERQTIVTRVDLNIGAGETIGIVGESGSGKSLTARAMIGLLPPGVFGEGEVSYRGQNILSLSEKQLGRIRGPEIGLILQDPFTMLNPLRLCGTQITEMLTDRDGRRLGRKARELEAHRRLSEVGIDERIVAHRYPFQLSGGMRQRVGIAAALARNPRLLIADEPSTALDVTTQKEILQLLRSLQETRGMALVIITHDLRVAFATASRIYVMYAGTVVESGEPARLEREPCHPYTLGLLLSEPSTDRRLAELAAIPGLVPRPDDVAGKCPFAARCEWAVERCRATTPVLAPVSDDGMSACLRTNEIREAMRTKRSALRPVGTVAIAAGQPLVRIEDATKIFRSHAFGGSGEPVAALSAVSLSIGAGESVGLVGESGSGKTTLARCLVDLEQLTSGRLVVGNVEMSAGTALMAADRRRLVKTVQMVFQDPYSSLNPMRTIEGTLREAVQVAGPGDKATDARVDELLDLVGLPREYRGRKPVALSGGERQRVAIARALAVRPRLLVCDEPVSALDVSVQAQILNLFTRLRQELGMSYLFISHDLAVVRQVAETVYVLYKGSVVESGPADAILDHPRHAYTMKLVASVPRAENWLTGPS